MENAGPSQNSQLPFSSYPAKSTALLQQRVWLSPEFGDEYDIYADTVQHHGATLVTEMGGEGTFHMLPRFEGPIFNELMNNGHRIVSLSCVFASVQRNQPLPELWDSQEAKYLPVHSLQFAAHCVVSSSLPDALRINVRTMVKLGCGSYMEVLTPPTTVLVSMDPTREKYFFAKKHHIPVVLPEWINRMFVSDGNVDMTPYLLPCFYSLSFSATGIALQERKALEQLITANGGSFVQDLTPTCTHLIVDNDNLQDSAKLRFALQRNMTIVSTKWVARCVRKARYDVSDLSLPFIKNSINTDAISDIIRTIEGSMPSASVAPTPANTRFAGLMPMVSMNAHYSESAQDESADNESFESSEVPDSPRYVGNTPLARNFDFDDSNSDTASNSSEGTRLSRTEEQKYDPESSMLDDSRSEGIEPITSSNFVSPPHFGEQLGQASIPSRIPTRIYYDNNFSNSEIKDFKSGYSANKASDFESSAASVSDELQLKNQAQKVKANANQFLAGCKMVVVGLSEDEEQAKAMASHIEECESFGGVIVDLQHATHILIHVANLLPKEECRFIHVLESRVHVVSYEWLWDSIVFLEKQNENNYKMQFDPSSNSYRVSWASSTFTTPSSTNPTDNVLSPTSEKLHGDANNHLGNQSPSHPPQNTPMGPPPPKQPSSHYSLRPQDASITSMPPPSSSTSKSVLPQSKNAPRSPSKRSEDSLFADRPPPMPVIPPNIVSQSSRPHLQKLASPKKDSVATAAAKASTVAHPMRIQLPNGPSLYPPPEHVAAKRKFDLKQSQEARRRKELEAAAKATREAAALPAHKKHHSRTHGTAVTQGGNLTEDDSLFAAKSSRRRPRPTVLLQTHDTATRTGSKTHASKEVARALPASIRDENDSIMGSPIDIGVQENFKKRKSPSTERRGALNLPGLKKRNPELQEDAEKTEYAEFLPFPAPAAMEVTEAEGTAKPSEPLQSPTETNPEPNEEQHEEPMMFFTPAYISQPASLEHSEASIDFPVDDKPSSIEAMQSKELSDPALMTQMIRPPIRILKVEPPQGSRMFSTIVMLTLTRAEESMRVVFGQVLEEERKERVTCSDGNRTVIVAVAPRSALALTVPLCIQDANGNLLSEKNTATFTYTD